MNVASYVGLGTLLGCVLGDSLARPDAAQLEAMKPLLEEAMRDGALGLSTMLAGPRELAVTTDDIVALCSVVRRYGGLFSSHIRNEGTDVFAAVKEAIDVGRRAGVPVDIIHLKIADQTLWHRMGEIVALIDEARREGSTSRPTSILTHAVITTWLRSSRHGRTRAAQPTDCAAQGSLKLRDRLKREIRTGLPGWYNHYTAVGGDWGRMLISPRLSRGQSAIPGPDDGSDHRGKVGRKEPGLPIPSISLFDFLIEEDGSIGTNLRVTTPRKI